MADITMCKGRGCPVKEKCYRFNTKRSEYQSYFVTEPFLNGKCDYFWGGNSEQVFNQLKDIVNGKIQMETNKRG